MDNNGYLPTDNRERHPSFLYEANGTHAEHTNGLSYASDYASDYTPDYIADYTTDFSHYQAAGQTNADSAFTNIENPETKTKDRPKRKGKPWISILTDYASISTIHGIYHIASPQPFLIRRLLWLALFLGSSTLLALQITSNVLYFLSWPMSVDVRINYNDTVRFPSVTVCNQNAFRASEAYKYGIYEMVSEIFTEASSHDDTEHAHWHNTTSWLGGQHWHSVALDDLYHLTGHRAKDLIVGCEWHGSPCTSEDFQPILTDFGLCYTFNGKSEESPVRLASQTGSEGGLRLHLNIEQYDYMSGPNPGAGLKLQVHNPDEPPMVKDHGVALPPGSHAFISVKAVEVNNLKEPHGKCNDSVKLEYFDAYTMSTCKTDCKQRYLMDACGCRDIYMSPISRRTNDELPVCLLEQYLDCTAPALETFGASKDIHCHCPVPCYRLLYEQTVSYASTSNFDIQALLHDAESVREIQSKYIRAREVEQRVNERIVEEDKKVIEQFNQSTVAVLSILSRFKDQIQMHWNTLDRMYTKFQKRLTFHKDRGLDNVKYTYEHDFIRAWQVYRERAFNYVTQDYFDVPAQIRETLQNTFIPSGISTRRLVTLPLRSMLSGRLATMQRAKEYLNTTRHGFYTGDSWLRFRLTIDRHYDESYITLDILQTGIDDEQPSYDSMQIAFGWMTEGIQSLLQVCEQYENFGTFNETLHKTADDSYQAGARRYNYRVFIYESRVIAEPLEAIENIIEHFERLNRTLTSSSDDLMRYISTLHNKIDAFLNDPFSVVVRLSQNATEYLFTENNTKTALSIAATSKDMGEVSSAVSSFFPEVRAMLQDLYECTITLKLRYHDMWIHLLSEQTTLKFYQQVYNDSQAFLANNTSASEAFYYNIFSHMLNMDEAVLRSYPKDHVVELMNGDLFGMDPAEVLANITELFEGMASTMDASAVLGHVDDQLLADLEQLVTLLETFHDDNSIGASFYRDNFMRLDVYMQELSYEVVTQQQAYDSAKLLSDIGGSMGLFIGGSVLSLFELIDIFIHNGMRRLFQK